MYRKSWKREGDELIVEYSNGEVKRFNLYSLAQCWRQMTNDDFYARFGFSWPFEFEAYPMSLVLENDATEGSCPSSS